MLLRTEEVLRIRLDGAEFWDVREYVREQERADGSPWKLGPRQKPFADSTLWWYIAQADRLARKSVAQSARKAVRNHLAKRRNLYGKAMVSGDLRTALGVLQDEARLLGLYPAVKAEVKTTATASLRIVEEIVDGEPDPNDSAAPGAAGVPPE